MLFGVEGHPAKMCQSKKKKKNYKRKKKKEERNRDGDVPYHALG